MQHATLSSSDTTGRTGDGGYLFGREFFLFHLNNHAGHPAAKLFNLPHLSELSDTRSIVIKLIPDKRPQRVSPPFDLPARHPTAPPPSKSFRMYSSEKIEGISS